MRTVQRITIGVFAAVAAVAAGPASTEAQLVDRSFGNAEGFYRAAGLPPIEDLEVQRTNGRAGKVIFLADEGQNHDSSFSIGRLHPNGTLDDSFGEAGFAELAGSAADTVVGPDDSVFALSTEGDVYKLTPEGDVVGDFGTPGPEVSYPQLQHSTCPPGCHTSTSEVLMLDSSGALIVAGSNRVALRESGAPAGTSPFLARLGPTGELDTGFGEAGYSGELSETHHAWRLIDAAPTSGGSVAVLAEYERPCATCRAQWASAVVPSTGSSPWQWQYVTNGLFENGRGLAGLAQLPSGQLVAAGRRSEENAIAHVPFPGDQVRFKDDSTISDLVALSDGGLVALGYMDSAMTATRLDAGFAPVSQVSEIPPGLLLPRLHTGVAYGEAVYAVASARLQRDAGELDFITRIPLSAFDAQADDPDSPGTDLESDLGMRVLKKRLPRTVGALLNRGATAKVTCAGHCLVTMKLLTRGRATRESGVSGVVGRGQLGLWPGETGTVGAYLTDRARRKLGAATDYATRVKTRVRFAVEPLP